MRKLAVQCSGSEIFSEQIPQGHGRVGTERVNTAPEELTTLVNTPVSQYYVQAL